MNKSAMEALKHQNIEEASSLLLKSLQILKLSKPSEPSFKLRAVTLNNLGILYRSTKDYAKALEYLSSALKVARNLTTDTINRAGTHLNICAIKSSLNQHDQALQHALTAIQMLSMKKSDFSPSLVVAYHSAGIEYQYLNLPLKARAHFEYGFNISAQKLGKTHQLTLSLEEALQDYYGYKAKTRQKSTEGYLESRRFTENLKAMPRYVPPIEKIYRNETNLKNRPDNTFLNSPQKVRKRIFVRQELSSRVRDLVMKDVLRDESLQKFKMDVQREGDINRTRVDERYEEREGRDEWDEKEERDERQERQDRQERDERQEREERDLNDFRENSEFERLMNSFRENVLVKDENEASMLGIRSRNGVRANSVIQSIKDEDRKRAVLKREEGNKGQIRWPASSPCGDRDASLEAKIGKEEKIRSKTSNCNHPNPIESPKMPSEPLSDESESIHQVPTQEEPQENPQDDQEPSESSQAEYEEVDIPEENLKAIKATIDHLDEKVQAYSAAHKKLLLTQATITEKYEPQPKSSHHRQSIMIQKHIRGWLQHKKFKELKQKAILIQKHWKEYKYRQYLARTKNIKAEFGQQLIPLMLVVKPVMADCEVQTDLIKKPENMIETQSIQLIEPYNMYKSFHRTIVFIQAHIRGFIERSRVRKIKRSVVKVQSAFRMFPIRKIYLDILHAIIFIQQMFREYRERKRRRMARSGRMSKTVKRSLRK